jgi:two-component system, cell cycle response regulator
MDVSPRLRAGLRTLGALTGLALLAYVAHAAFGLGSPDLDGLFEDWVYCALTGSAGAACVARSVTFQEERAAWLVMGIGLLAWTAGEVAWSLSIVDPDRSYPAVSDVLQLGFYPASYTALLLLARSRTDSFRSSLWLDGAIAALTVAALIATLAFDPIVEATSGSTVQVAINLAYPVGDLLLVGMVVAVFGLNGWRPDPVWLLLGGGLAFTAVADGLYLVQSAEGTYVRGGLVDLAWPASALLVAVAAWQPARKKITIHDWLVIAVPVGCGLVAVQLLVYDHFERSVNVAAVSLAAWALLLALARMALAFLENQRTISQSRAEARTDPLTGLRNRRSLLADLEVQLGLASLASPRALLLFDLDGFKEYNDAFGHPAGDGLLVRLAARLADAVGSGGEAYRLGGDEFCVLVSPGRNGIDPVLAACSAALNERGEGFEVTSSFGVVVLPEEASTPTLALQLADRRMYARKGGRRMSAGRQSRDVLLRTLSERRPDLHLRLRDIGELALAVGRELHMGPEALDEVARAAELHDVGKIAVPDAILDKPGALDPVEWSFMRRHPLIGERILLAAPALRPVARLVRSSHERWDGSGYPDGLHGDAIPLGARVVAVCDAFDAMTSERPYRASVSEANAIEELRRCAGTQFDPMVVEAFCRVIARERPTHGEVFR